MKKNWPVQFAQMATEVVKASWSNEIPSQIAKVLSCWFLCAKKLIWPVQFAQKATEVV